VALKRPTDGLTPKSEYDSRKRDEARAKKVEPPEVDSTDDSDKFKIVRYCAKKWEDAQRVRKPHETFDIAWMLYNGDMWSDRRPPWRATITINKIRAFITFIQAIMTDNKPRWHVEPRLQGSEAAADLLNRLVDRDWDENDMQEELSLLVLYGLIWGYAFVKMTYDPYANGGRGKHCVTVIPPYRIYTNKTAKDVTFDKGIEYIIHEEEMTMGWVRRNFPRKANVIRELQGLQRKDDGDPSKNRDFVTEGTGRSPQILSAMQINGNYVSPQAPMSHPNYLDENDHETVNIKEYWLRDDTLEPYDRQVVRNGKAITVPLVEKGETVMDPVGTKTIFNEFTEQQQQVPDLRPKMVPLMETAWRAKYPNGRLVMIAADRVLLRDIPNPYQTDGFPFAM
jgi:hypothetical protein